MIKVHDRWSVEHHLNPARVVKSTKVYNQEDKWAGYQVKLTDGSEVYLDLNDHERFLDAFAMKARR